MTFEQGGISIYIYIRSILSRAIGYCDWIFDIVKVGRSIKDVWHFSGSISNPNPFWRKGNDIDIYKDNNLCGTKYVFTF